MTTTLIAVFGVVVAVLAVVAAAVQAVLLRRQIKESSDVALATLYQQIARQFIEFDVFFVDRPYLYEFFYANAPVAADSSRAIEVRMTSEMLFDLAEYCHANKAALGTLAHDWENYFHNLYKSSPAL